MTERDKYTWQAEALKEFAGWLCREIPGNSIISDPNWWAPRIFHAALRALAAQQPVEEPVGWAQIGMLNGKRYLREPYSNNPYPPTANVIRNLNLVPLYTHPQASAPATRPADVLQGPHGALTDAPGFLTRRTHAIFEAQDGAPTSAPAEAGTHTARGMQGQTGPVATPYVPTTPAVGVTPDLDALVAHEVYVQSDLDAAEARGAEIASKLRVDDGSPSDLDALVARLFVPAKP